MQYKLRYANQLDEATIKDIEIDTNKYADADQFRIFHAHGRTRGMWCSLLTLMGASTFLNGGRNGKGWCSKNPYAASAIFFGSWIVWYQIWSRKAGYTSQKYNEFQYAMAHKQLRNV